MKTEYTVSQLLNTVDKKQLIKLKDIGNIILCFEIEGGKPRYYNYYTRIHEVIIGLLIDKDEHISRGTLKCYIDNPNKLVNKKFIFLRIETIREEINRTIKGEH